MTDYTKFDCSEGESRTAVKPRAIDMAEALERCAAYGLLPQDTATTIIAYKEGYNDAVLQFQGPYA
jgi:hypothetical protein